MQHNRALVLYISKYGSSRRYAELFCKQTGLTPHPLKEGAALLGDADAVILFCAVYASRLGCEKFLKKYARKLEGKQVTVFAQGLSPADDATLALLRRRLPGKTLFYGRGAMRFSALTTGDRLLCRMLHAMLKGKDPAQYEEAWMRTFMECYGKDTDFTDEAFLAPLLSRI